MIGQIAFLGGRSNTALSPCFAMPLNARGERFSSKMGKRIESRDYWLDSSEDINSLEARALQHSLLAFRDHIRDSRVDVHTDSQTLKTALEDFGCKSSSVNESLKEILQCSRQLNFAINVRFVPSHDNPADVPSQVCSDLDCMLYEEAWGLVERSFWSALI